MPGRILVGYASRYGSTQEVAEAIAATLREQGFAVDLELAHEVKSMAGYSAVVLGAPLFMYRWHKDALKFLSRHHKAPLKLPVAVFVLGPVHDPHDEKEWQDSNAQIRKELEKVPWFTPAALEMFGGRYDPSKLRFPLSTFAGAEPASDIRDWDAIRAWTVELAGKLKEVG